jgi:hypothetical protein
VDITIPASEQPDHFYACGSLSECNKTMDRIYGLDSPQQIIGGRLGDLLIRDGQKNAKYLLQFI